MKKKVFKLLKDLGLIILIVAIIYAIQIITGNYMIVY